MKYRKKPVVIEAMQWTGDVGCAFRLGEWWAGWGIQQAEAFGFPGDGTLHVRTLEDGKNGEAKHVADPGDWIIRGIKGEYYACKPDIFAATYEPVEGT